MKKLAENPDIVIKRADKGGAVTIMTRNHYKSMIYDHLNDQNTYKKLESNIDNKICKDVNRLITKYQQHFTNDERKYFKTTGSETSNFYV